MQRLGFRVQGIYIFFKNIILSVELIYINLVNPKPYV